MKRCYLLLLIVLLCSWPISNCNAEYFYDENLYLFFGIDREKKEATVGTMEVIDTVFWYSHFNARPVYVELSNGDMDPTNYWENIIIPSTITYLGETYTVTGINDYAFYNDRKIKTVTLPETIKRMGVCAFFQAGNLESINIPSQVDTIQACTFGNCWKLKSMHLPDSLECIGAEAFFDCEEMIEINIPCKVDSILENTFKHCFALSKLVIEDSSIPLFLDRNFGTIDDMAYPEYVKPTIRGCFSDSPLTYLYIGRNIIYSVYGTPPFMQYKYIGTFEEYKPSFQSYGNHYSHLEFGDKVTEIAEGLFSSVTIDHDLILPPYLKTVYKNAFDNCDLLNRTLIFPETLDSIGDGAFCASNWRQANLRDVVFHSNNPPKFSNDSPFGNQGLETQDIIILHVPEGLGSTYRKSKWGVYLVVDSLDEMLTINVRTPGSLYSRLLAQDIQKEEVCRLKLKGTPNEDDWAIVKSMCQNQCYELDLSELAIEDIPIDFTGNKRIYKMAFPQTLKTIRSDEFKECLHLSGVIDIPVGVGEIGENAFWRTAVENIIYQDSIKIRKNAFWDCWNLNDLYLHGENTYIDYQAFWGSGARKVIIGSGVYVENEAFFYNQQLKEVVFEDGVKFVGSRVFGQTDSLKNVTFEGKIKTFVAPFEDNSTDGISHRATKYTVNIRDLASWCQMPFQGEDVAPLYFAGKVFLNDEEIANITIPETVSAIGPYSFYGIETLKTIQLHEGITSIGDMAFKSCTNLESIKIPESIESIGTQAFDSCEMITEIDFPNRITSIGSGAFQGCSNLRKIVAPWDNPFNVTSSTFSGVSSDCYLYIPIGTASKYFTAGWDAIPNVKEAGIINLKSNIGGSIAYNEELVRNESKKLFYSPYRSFNLIFTPDDGFYIKKVKLNGINVTADLEGNKLFIEEPEENLEVSVIFADENIAMGDVNGDGIINETDAICVLNHILKNTPTSFHEYASDMDDDDVVNVTDAILLVHKILTDSSSTSVKVINSLLKDPE